MKKMLAVALAVLLAVSALGLSGCREIKNAIDNPVDHANVAIKAANDDLKKFTASDAKVQGLATELNAVDVTPAGATKALEIIVKLRAELAAQKSALESARTSLLSIKQLDVKPEFKKYADLEVVSIDTRIKVVGEGTKLYDQMDIMYAAIRDKKLTNTLSNTIRVEIDTIANNIAALSDQATAESKTASDYFEAQKLGGQ
jgi:hypothetical protein